MSDINCFARALVVEMICCVPVIPQNCLIETQYKATRRAGMLNLLVMNNL